MTVREFSGESPEMGRRKHWTEYDPPTERPSRRIELPVHFLPEPSPEQPDDNEYLPWSSGLFRELPGESLGPDASSDLSVDSVEGRQRDEAVDAVPRLEVMGGPRPPRDSISPAAGSVRPKRRDMGPTSDVPVPRVGPAREAGDAPRVQPYVLRQAPEGVRPRPGATTEVPRVPEKPIEKLSPAERRGHREIINVPRLMEMIERTHPAAVREAAKSLPELRRLFDERLNGIRQLVDRVRQLPAVKADRDLIDELSALRGADPRESLPVLRVVLAEAYGERNMAKVPLLTDVRSAAPTELLELIGSLREAIHGFEHRHSERPTVTVGVAPAADGTIDGKPAEGPVSRVEIHDSVGVVCGDDNEVHVLHFCEVEEPIIEIAELLEAGKNSGPAFGFSKSAVRSKASLRVSAETSTVSEDLWTTIRRCTGVAVGDDVTMNINRHYKIEGCRVSPEALLQDDEVRAALEASRDDSTDPMAARNRLVKAARRAVATTDVSNLVSEDEVAKAAAKSARPSIRQSGARLVISHGTGIAVGEGWSISSQREIQAGAARIK